MILVTGSRGYIGSNLMMILEKTDVDAKGYDLKDGQDILNYEMLRFCARDCDTIVHLAAIPGVGICEEFPIDAINTNINGTAVVNRVAEEVGARMIYISSFAVMGNNRDTVYGLTKRLGEKIVLRTGGIVLRLSNVWGGDNYLEMKDSAIARLNKGTWEDRGHGKEIRDFVKIDRVCHDIIEMFDKDGPLVYGVCSGYPITINELKRRFYAGEFKVL